MRTEIGKIDELVDKLMKLSISDIYCIEEEDIDTIILINKRISEFCNVIYKVRASVVGRHKNSFRDKTNEIKDIIFDNPGITKTEIARKHGYTDMAIHKSVAKLIMSGKIRRVKSGNSIKLYIDELSQSHNKTSEAEGYYIAVRNR